MKTVSKSLRTASRISLAFLLLSLVATRANAQRPEIVTQAGHGDQELSTAFSPDSSLFATGDQSGTVKLWDARGGKLLRTIAAHEGRVSALVFSPDSQTLASASVPGGAQATNYADSKAKLWHLRTGKLLLEAALSSTISDLEPALFAFGPDSKVFAAPGEDDSITLWDAHDGRLLHTLKGLARTPVSLTFSPGGTIVAANGSDGYPPKVERETKLWEVESGRLFEDAPGCAVVGFDASGKPVAVCGQVANVFVAASPGGGRFVVWLDARTLGLFDSQSSEPRQRISGFDLRSGAEVFFSLDGQTLVVSGAAMVGEKYVRNYEVWVWDASGPRLLHGHRGDYFGALSPDGRFYTAPRSIGEDKSVTELFDTRSGKALAQFDGGGSGIFSPDGKLLLTGAQLWSVPDGKLLHEYPAGGDNISSLAFSPDGKAFASSRGEGYNKEQRYELWETRGGSLARTFPARDASEEDHYYGSVAFTPDGQLLATGDGQLRDVQTGTSVRAYKGDAVFGSKLYAVRADDFVELRDARSGGLLRRVRTPDQRAIALSPDERLLAVGFVDGAPEEVANLKLYDVATGRLLRGFKDIPGAHELIFSPDGRLLVVSFKSGSGGFVDNYVFDVRTGKRLTDFMEEENEETGKAEVLAFNSDSRTVVMNGRVPDTVDLRDATTGRVIKTIKGTTPFAVSAAFSPDGKILATGDADTAIRFWQVETGSLLATALSFEGGGWLVLTPDGLFDGSPDAWNKMLWRFGGDTFNVAPAEIFFNEFYHPGLLSDIFAGKRPAAALDISRKDRRQPRVEIELTDPQLAPGGLSASRTVALRLKVTEESPDAAHAQQGSGARDVRLFRNGSLVKAWRGDVLEGKSGATLEVSAPVIAGENRFTAYAFNRDNVKSADAGLVVRGAGELKRAGTAYVLAIGVNQYANANYNLRYAVADAQVFADEWRQQQESLRQYERVETVLLFDHEATKANMLAALARLAEKTQPEDAVVVYFAGHGTAYREQFYLLPHDLGYAGERNLVDKAAVETILARSISDRELEGAFEKINAAQILFVIDACNSGQALEAEEKRRGPMNSKGLAQLAYEKGMYVLTASQSFEAAQEAAQLGHGLLTYALVEEGLKGSSADAEPKDGEVRVREWLNYATRRVPEMQIKEMKSALARGIKLSFADEERALNIPNRSGQRPRVFYRRELESQPLVVARITTAAPPASDKPKAPPGKRPAPAKASPKPRVKKR